LTRRPTRRTIAEPGEVGIVDKAFIQIAPVRRQNVHRCAPGFPCFDCEFGRQDKLIEMMTPTAPSICPTALIISQFIAVTLAMTQQS
jgi:hypothetical protein